ncbi:hypothetical protein ACI2L1_04255 [Streptomyces sp. NPDC019531]|uniref:hypothetical protein n=1 Tax=Streptomyces sp. NPDC019531 TaxID=3365062 RepID=UPI00384B19E8
MSNRIKRYATICAAVATATVGMVSTAPSASAASSVNIRGQESFNTDVFMDKLCGDMSTRDKAFLFNIHTGEVVNSAGNYGKAPYYRLVSGSTRQAYSPAPRGYHYALSPGWEGFGGSCEYPQTSSWTWEDYERRISNDSITNCASGSATLAVNESYATTRGTTITVGGNTKGSVKALDIFTGEIGASFGYSWSISKTHTLGRQASGTVAHGRKGHMDARPIKRTVRVAPVFHVEQYNWSDGQSEIGTVSHTWRGRGYDRIRSYGYYVDGKADVLNRDGTPAMDFVTRDEPGRC